MPLSFSEFLRISAPFKRALPATCEALMPGMKINPALKAHDSRISGTQFKYTYLKLLTFSLNIHEVTSHLQSHLP